MNAIHNFICSSRWWERRAQDELVPWGVRDVELGEDVLEIGPGFGATTRRLVQLVRPGALTIVELDQRYCARLRASLGDAVEVVQGDATELPLDDARFSA